MTVTDSCFVLDDLPNPATEKAFEQLARTLFVSDNDPASKIEAYLTSPASFIPDKQERSASREEYRELKRHTTSEHGSNGLLRDSKAVIEEPESGIVVINTWENLNAYTSVSRDINVYFIRKRNSYASISVSLPLFEHLCLEASIPKSFRDYLVYFGRREHELEIAPPPFSLASTPPEGPTSPRVWEAMGIIRYVEAKDIQDVAEPTSPWSIRQTAVFYGFSGVQIGASCLLISPSSSAEEVLRNMWCSQKFRADTAFETLYVLYHFAVCNWRPYAVAITRELERHEMEVLGTLPDDTGPVALAGPEKRPALLFLDKKILTAKLAIQSTRADLQFISAELHRYSSEQTHGPISSNLRELTRKFSESGRDLDTNLMRLEQLQSRLQGITNLVSSFLDLQSGYSLQVLTQESKMENEIMRRLNERMADVGEKNAEEAASVTVLAVLSLIYLPFTVVSNFFSTSFVGTNSSSRHIFVTRDWWILFVVAIPLTIMTISFWRLWSAIKVKEKYPLWWRRLGLPQNKKPRKTHWDYY